MNGSRVADAPAEATDRLAQTLDLLTERVARYRTSDLVLVYCNQAWAAQFDARPEDLVGRPMTELLAPHELTGLFAQLARLSPLTPSLPDVEPRPASRAPGRWIEWTDRYLMTPEGPHVLAVGRDVTDRRAAEQQLAESEARFRGLAERSSDLIFRLALAPVPHLNYASPSIERLTGWPTSAFTSDLRFMLEQTDDRGRDVLLGALDGGEPPERFDLRLRRPDRSWIVLELQVVRIPEGWQGGGRDVTEVRRLQDDLSALALRDPLTGLANRRLLDILLGTALSRRTDPGTCVLVTYLDLDRFKEINDTFGHAAGDAVLVEVAQRLEHTVRGADVVARLGGDEFVTVHEADRDGVASVLDRIAAGLGEPYRLPDGTEVRCEASIGHHVVTGTVDAADVLAEADAAMYAVKRARRADRTAPAHGAG